jgi:hypothetical protein
MAVSIRRWIWRPLPDARRFHTSLRSRCTGTYQSGPRRVWMKVRNPASIAALAAARGQTGLITRDSEGNFVKFDEHLGD